MSERAILFSFVDNDQLSVAHDLLRIVGRISRVMLHVGLCVFLGRGWGEGVNIC